MPNVFDRLNFSDNPFATYVAENEPQIEQYFVRPPYFDEVSKNGYACRSIVLFGARGAGKSATRMAFYKDSWARWQDQGKAPLTVVMDDYSRIAVKAALDVDLGAFVIEVGYLTVEALLLWLAALEDEDRTNTLGALTDQEEALVVGLVDRFYLSRSALVRNATIREPLKLLNQAWHKRSRLWMEKRWDAVGSLISTIASGFAHKVTGENLAIDGGLRDLLKADKVQFNDGLFARILLSRFSDLAKIFGFSGVVVLVDKVDETSLTADSAASTAKLLYPLLSTTQLLEVDDFGWLFFLWDKVQQSYSEEPAIRLDKIANANIKWEEKYLKSMVSARLHHFSAKSVASFQQLCDKDFDGDSALDEIIELCMKSPRELIRVLNTVFREHDEKYGAQTDGPLLVRDSVDIALDKYAAETLPRIYNKAHLQQLLRLNLQIFTNAEVQGGFRINVQSARAKIKAWEDAGMVAKTGTRQSRTEQGGKPANEYSVVDQRVRRILQRQVSLGPEFDPAPDDEENSFASDPTSE